MGFEGPKFCSYIPSDFCRVGGDVLFIYSKDTDLRSQLQVENFVNEM